MTDIEVFRLWRIIYQNRTTERKSLNKNKMSCASPVVYEESYNYETLPTGVVLIFSCIYKRENSYPAPDVNTSGLTVLSCWDFQ